MDFQITRHFLGTYSITWFDDPTGSLRAGPFNTHAEADAWAKTNPPPAWLLRKE